MCLDFLLHSRHNSHTHTHTHNSPFQRWLSTFASTPKANFLLHRYVHACVGIFKSICELHSCVCMFLLDFIFSSSVICCYLFLLVATANDTWHPSLSTTCKRRNYVAHSPTYVHTCIHTDTIFLLWVVVVHTIAVVVGQQAFV